MIASVSQHSTELHSVSLQQPGTRPTLRETSNTFACVKPEARSPQCISSSDGSGPASLAGSCQRHLCPRPVRPGSKLDRCFHLTMA
ncbi:hypothetical protein E2C01_097707 [Portunus trituberculatus]|uniref:Uncharacterized protein n=1 Tax=Portunus trituberculatus TaxID=210409 RepID=A0A5B7KAA9_PORTR|nr:hypothetical protein [Portunus trituberculatus]